MTITASTRLVEATDRQNQAVSGTNAIVADSPKAKSELPAIPDKLYFTIGEVSKLCDVPAHVLRYWERKVPGLSQVSRRNNRRYYRREDVVKARRIGALIYGRGMTIQGAVQALEAPEAPDVPATTFDVREESPVAVDPPLKASDARALREVCESLKEVSQLLSKGLRNL